MSRGLLNRLIQAAGEAWKRQDYEQSLAMLERASRLDPNNARLLLDLGSAYGMQYDYAAADRCFARAVRVAPKKAEVMAMAGAYCRNFGRYEMARRYFEQAIALPDATADTFAKLAELYERFRLSDEAVSLVERGLKLDPDCALALLALARLERSAGSLESAEKQIQSIVARADPESWSTRIRAWYELGAIRDKQGRYDEAMAAFLEAKNLIKPNAGPFIEGQRDVHARLKEAEASITEETFRTWRKQSKDPPFDQRVTLLCGHPRSGTTLLEQVLDAHPEIVSAEETPIFFQIYLSLKRGRRAEERMAEVLAAASPSVLAKSRDRYFRFMELTLGNPIGGRLLIDKNPSLTALVPAVIRLLPETKFLAALRDPRDVCLSCFMQPLPLNQVSAIFLSLEGAVEEYISLMGFWRTISERMPNPRLEIRYEDMVANLEAVSRRALAFLDLPWSESVLGFDKHASQKLVRSPSYADVTQPVFKGAVGRWRNYEKFLEPYLGKLAPLVKAFGYD